MTTEEEVALRATVSQLWVMSRDHGDGTQCTASCANVLRVGARTAYDRLLALLPDQ